MLRFSSSIVVLVAVQFCTNLLADDGVSPEQFSKLHALIKPTPSESKWERIPWLVSLWEARERAAAEGKPILLWEMDGHPLGCT